MTSFTPASSPSLHDHLINSLSMSPLLSFILGIIVGGVVAVIAVSCLAGGSRDNIDETHDDHPHTIHFNKDDLPPVM